MCYKTLGQLLESERERRGITQSELSWGLCNVSTYNRYERDEIIPNKFMLDVLFERLGKNPNTIHYLMSGNELVVRKMREEINTLRNVDEIEAKLKEYECVNNKKNVNIHEQFFFQIKGKVYEEDGNDELAIFNYRNALKKTKIEKFNYKGIYSRIEFYVLFRLAVIEKDIMTLMEMEQYLRNREDRDVIKMSYYADIIMEIISVFKLDDRTSYELLCNAIEYKKRILQYRNLRDLLLKKKFLVGYLDDYEKKIVSIEETILQLKGMVKRDGGV